MSNFQKFIRRFQKKKSAESAAGKRGRKGLRHRKRKPLSKKAKIWIAVGSTLGALLIAGIITGVVWFQKTFRYDHNPITKDPDKLGVVQAPEGAEEIVNIALFGIDSRDADYKGLSDSIMIISIDPEKGAIRLVSVMRDSLVKVEGYGHQKINAAYNRGGPELAIKTLNQNFKLNITNYATVDFVGMAAIVDAVGGVEVELTKSEIYYTNLCIDEIADARGTKRDYVSKAGVQTLNGIQAVGFARVRAVPTVNGTRDDYGRTERQRLVMNQLFQKALTLSWTSYPGLIQSLLPYIETSMGFDDIIDLASILKNDGISMQQNRIPMDDAIISGGFNVKGLGSCVYYDLEFAADLLHAFFYDGITFEDYVAANGIRKNPWYGSSGSSGASKPSSNSNSASNNSSSSGGTTDTATSTDSGTGSTDTDTSVSTSPAILPSTDTSSASTSSSRPSTSDTTDTGTQTDTADTGTSTDSSSATSSSDKPVSSDTSDTSDSTDSSDTGSTSSDTAGDGSDSDGENE